MLIRDFKDMESKKKKWLTNAVITDVYNLSIHWMHARGLPQPPTSPAA